MRTRLTAVIAAVATMVVGVLVVPTQAYAAVTCSYHYDSFTSPPAQPPWTNYFWATANVNSGPSGCRARLEVSLNLRNSGGYLFNSTAGYVDFGTWDYDGVENGRRGAGVNAFSSGGYLLQPLTFRLYVYNGGYGTANLLKVCRYGPNSIPDVGADCAG